MLVISSLSVEYVRVPVSADQNGVVVDPTADTVQMAFMAPGTTPASGDWKTASWETDATTKPSTYYARLLVGPSQNVLAAGFWDVFVKVTDNPETPVRRAGRIEVV